MRARLSVAAGITLAIAITGCTTTGEDMPTSDQQTSVSDTTRRTTDAAGGSAAPTSADLEATVTASAEIATAPEGFTSGLEGVLVTYTVTNDGPEPIKVATGRAAAQAASAVAAPEGVWTSQGSEDTVVRLSKQVFGLPAGVLPNELHRASSVTVEPGSSTQDTAFTPLPLRPELPSGSETITVTEKPLSNPGSVTRFEVCVQIAPGPTPGQGEPFASTIAADATGTSLVCSDPVELPEESR